VLRYADVERLATDTRTESNALDFVLRAIPSGPLAEWWRQMLTNLNGPRHLELRGLVSRAFTPRAVERVRPRIGAIAREILIRHAGAGTLEFSETLADELPIRLICEMLGVEGSDHADFARWSTALGRVLAAVQTPAVRREGEAAALAMNARIAELIRERRASPRSDLFSALLDSAAHSEIAIDDAELVTLVVNLIFGGHDTSRSLLTIGLALLLFHPEELRKLRADPGLAASAGEEILRCEPIVPWMAREAHSEIELPDGLRLAPGGIFFLSILAANRDPDVFPDPDRFDIARRGARSFSFGWGPHVCLGSSLARAEVQEALPAILDACAEIEPQIERPKWVPHTFIRRIEGLPLRFRLR
jgi:cytochrome P450